MGSLLAFHPLRTANEYIGKDQYSTFLFPHFVAVVSMFQYPFTNDSHPVFLLTTCRFFRNGHFYDFVFECRMYIGFRKCSASRSPITSCSSHRLISPVRCLNSFMTSGVEKITVTPSFGSDFHMGRGSPCSRHFCTISTLPRPAFSMSPRRYNTWAISGFRSIDIRPFSKLCSVTPSGRASEFQISSR